MALVWQHVAQWSLGRRLDGRLIPPIPLPHPSGRLFGCGLDGSVRAAIRAQGPFTLAYQNPQACTT